jgi:hypothetical protein
MRAIRLPLSSAAPTSSISWVNGVAGMLTVANARVVASTTTIAGPVKIRARDAPE